MKEITCTITKKLAVLSEKGNGYSKQVNMVSWNNAEAKLDIREWSPNGKSMKGVTMNEEEAEKLYEALSKMYGEKE